MTRTPSTRRDSATSLRTLQPTMADDPPPSSRDMGDLNNLLRCLRISNTASILFEAPASIPAPAGRLRQRARAERSASVREHLLRHDIRPSGEDNYSRASAPPASRATSRAYDRLTRSYAASIRRLESNSGYKSANERTVPNPPWLESPAVKQQSVDTLSSALSNLAIVQRDPTPEQVSTGNAAPAQTWYLPPADPAEEAPEPPIALIGLQGALDARGADTAPARVRITKYRRRRARRSASDSDDAAIPLTFGRVTTIKQCKVRTFPYCWDNSPYKKRLAASRREAASSECESVPNYFIMAMCGRMYYPPTYNPPVYGPYFPYDYSAHT